MKLESVDASRVRARPELEVPRRKLGQRMTSACGEPDGGVYHVGEVVHGPAGGDEGTGDAEEELEEGVSEEG